MGMLSPAAADSSNSTNGTARYVQSQLDTTFFNPGEHKETFDSTTDPRFDGYIARQYHKCAPRRCTTPRHATPRCDAHTNVCFRCTHSFSIHWTPQYIAWTLDEVVFRNVNKVGRAAYEMRSPWRPSTYRLIFHTGNGSLHPLPSAHVYIKRLAYAPLQQTPLLATAQGTEFAASAAMWGLAYALGMLMLACGVRAIASNRHHQILDDDEAGIGLLLQPLLDAVAAWGGGAAGAGAEETAPLTDSGAGRVAVKTRQPAKPRRPQGAVVHGL